MYRPKLCHTLHSLQFTIFYHWMCRVERDFLFTYIMTDYVYKCKIFWSVHFETDNFCVINLKIGNIGVRDETRHQSRKIRKATGPDKIPNEVLKMLNEIYSTGELPEEWLRLIFVIIPKKTSASKYDDYRLISLMIYLLKVFIWIIHAKIRPTRESEMGANQFG